MFPPRPKGFKMQKPKGFNLGGFPVRGVKNNNGMFGNAPKGLPKLNDSGLFGRPQRPFRDTDRDGIPDMLDKNPRTKARQPRPVFSTAPTVMNRRVAPPFKDTDGDLTPDLIDCKPNDPTRQGKIWDAIKERASSIKERVTDTVVERIKPESTLEEKTRWEERKGERQERREERHKEKLQKYSQRKELAEKRAELSEIKGKEQLSKISVSEARAKAGFERAKTMTERQKAFGTFASQKGMPQPSIMTPMPGGFGAPTTVQKKKKKKKKQGKGKKGKGKKQKTIILKLG